MQERISHPGTATATAAAALAAAATAAAATTAAATTSQRATMLKASIKQQAATHQRATAKPPRGVGVHADRVLPRFMRGKGEAALGCAKDIAKGRRRVRQSQCKHNRNE